MAQFNTVGRQLYTCVAYKTSYQFTPTHILVVQKLTFENTNEEELAKSTLTLNKIIVTSFDERKPI